MRVEWEPTVARTVDLDRDQLLVLESQPGTRLRVMYGSLWMTEEGFAQDVFVGTGDEVALKSRGLAVVEGLGLARVQVIAPRSAKPARLRSGFGAAAQSVRAGLRAAGSAALRLLHA